MDVLQPRRLMPFSEEEKEPFHFDTVAITQKFFKALWTQIDESLKQFINLLESFVIRQFVQKFQHRLLR